MLININIIVNYKNIITILLNFVSFSDIIL